MSIPCVAYRYIIYIYEAHDKKYHKIEMSENGMRPQLAFAFHNHVN